VKFLPLGKKLTIAIDIDGTVADSSKIDFDKADDNPNELMKAVPRSGAVKAVQKLHGQGHTIVFHTARGNDCKKVTARWLKKHGFPFHHLECEKFVAHVYIDDRAVNGCDWKKAMQEVRKPSLPGKLARKKGML
jgi:uncharacterized HAD superfamily protein